MRHPPRGPARPAGLLLVTMLAAAACDAGNAARTPGPAVRDSAGVTIVENSAPQLAAGSWRLSAEPLVEISGEGPTVEQMPLDPVSILEGPERRIIVADGNQVGWHALMFYDSTGAFLSRTGGRGGGPGELAGQLWAAVPYRGDSVAVWDRRGPTIHVFASDGAFGRKLLLPEMPVERPEGTMAFTSGFIGAFADGTLLSYPMGALELPEQPGPAWFRHRLLHLTPEGLLIATVGDFRFALYNHWDGQEQGSLLVPHTVYELTYGDELIRANTEAFGYEVLARDGTPRLIARKRVAPVPVDAAQRTQMIENRVGLVEAAGRATPEQLAEMRQRLQDAPAPAHMPFFSSVLADSDGNVWVERYRWPDPWTLPLDPQPTTWDVFAPGGEWLTEVVVPARVVLRSVSGDRAYGVLIDQNDVKHVRVYGLERTGG